MARNGRVVLVTSAQGGMGRTMAAAALATDLTKFGTVALVSLDNDTSPEGELNARGYLGEMEPVPGGDRSLFRPAAQSWTGVRASELDRCKLHVALPLSSLGRTILRLKATYDFVVVRTPQIRDNQAHNELLNVDVAIVLYRQNAHSHRLASQLVTKFESIQIPMVLPVANFVATASEVTLGCRWTEIAISRFHNQLTAALPTARKLGCNSVDTLYQATTMRFLPYLCYESANVALLLSASDGSKPGASIHTLAMLCALMERKIESE
jgi:cellulose biosynthesis protein BcsQ